jgi:hypothetical protein
MPEWREMFAHWVTCKHFLSLFKGRRLLGLWGDATKDEVKALGLDGFVLRFDETSNFVRGNQGAQTHVVPSATLPVVPVVPLKKFPSKKGKEPKESKCTRISLGLQRSPIAPLTVRDLNLELHGVHHNGRALFFDFGHIYFKVSPQRVLYLNVVLEAF